MDSSSLHLLDVVNYRQLDSLNKNFPPLEPDSPYYETNPTPTQTRNAVVWPPSGTKGIGMESQVRRKWDPNASERYGTRMRQ